MADELLTIQQIQSADETDWSAKKRIRAELIFDGALAQALRVAPCLKNPDFAGRAEARTILAEAVIRAVAADAGAPTQSTDSAGIFSHSRSYTDRAALPTLSRGDIANLQALCPKKRRVRMVRVRPMS